MPKQNYESYNNCISELQSRYEDRGIRASAQREASAQTKREMGAPNAYLISRMSRTPVSENYRNGEFNGQRYMTTGDFLKYYNNRKDRYPMQPAVNKSETAQTREFKRVPARPEEQRAKATPVAQAAPEFSDNVRTVARPAMKQERFDPCASTIVLPSFKEQKGLRAKINAMVRKWFPKDDKKENTSVFKREVPVAALGLIISSTIAMTMIIGSSVMASQANMQVSDLKYDIDALSIEEAMLEEKLMKKENLSEIKEYATESLGMISKDYVASGYISVSAEDSVESYDEEENAGVDFSTLLSGIFGE